MKEHVTSIVNKTNRKILHLSIAMLTCISASPQQILTLDACRQLALRNSTKIRSASLSAEAAEQAEKEAFTKYFPNVGVTGAGLVFSKPLMTQTLETGYPPPNDKAVVEMFKHGLIGGVTAMQPLYAGGQIVNGNRLAAAGTEISRLQQRMAVNDVLLETERCFWQLVALKEKMKTIAEAETMLRRIHADVRTAVETGLATRNDLLRAELEQHRLAGDRLKAENGLQMLKATLALYIGMETECFDIEQPAFDHIALPMEEPDAETLQQRPEYQLLEKNVDVAALQIRMELGKNLPSITVGAGYNYMNVDRGKPAEMKEHFGLALAVVSIPLSGWWGGSHALKKKKLELRAAETIRQEHADLLLLQMQNLWNGLNEAYSQLLLAQKSIAVAEENLRTSENHYKAGVSILSDLRDAQNLLQQARDRHIEAATTYHIKLAEYRQVKQE